MRTSLLTLAALSSILLVPAALPAAPVVADNFDRPDSTLLGSTSTGGYAWVQNSTTSGIAGNVASFNSRGSGTDPSGVISGLTMQDVDMSVTIRSDYDAGNNYFGGLFYRVASTGATFDDATAGYGVMVTQANWGGGGWTLGNSVSLVWRSNTVLAIAAIPSTVDTGTDHTLRVVSSGANQKVYFDGSLLINYTDPDNTHLVSGYVGLGTYYGNYSFDNLTINNVPEPASAFLAAASLTLLAVRRRRWTSRYSHSC